jgi:peptidoglycan/xylan/chitin deacetylase (PgdA/CDA1 family)
METAIVLLRSMLSLRSPEGPGGRLSVLIFHRVLPQYDPLFPDEICAPRFDSICAWLASWFNVLPLDEAVVKMRAGTLPARAACITFDDGYADNHDVALPILQRHGLCATFFIATGFLNGGRMWNDTIIEAIRRSTKSILDLSTLELGTFPLDSLAARKQAIAAVIDKIKYRSIDERIALTERAAELADVKLPQDLMMTSDQVRDMRRAGMQIGAHTVSHPILARLSADQCRQEIQGSKAFLEQLLQERIGLFAYPNGKPGEDYSAENMAIVQQLRFDAAVSTQWGASRQGDDIFAIKRFTPWDKARWRFGLRLLRNFRSA